MDWLSVSIIGQVGGVWACSQSIAQLGPIPVRLNEDLF